MSNYSELKKRGPGAPTLYKEEYCSGIVIFFRERFPRYKEVEEHTFDKLGNIVHTKILEKPLPPPTFSAYAVHLDVCLDTLKDWTRAHPEFALAYSKAKAIQQQFIIDNSMSNISPTAFSIFMLKNNHGWTDKIEQKVDAKVTLEDMVAQSFEGPEGENDDN